MKGHTATVKALLAKGAKVNAKEEKYGFTALMNAALGGHTVTVQALLDKGAIVNEKETKDGMTALIIASKEGHTATVFFLRPTKFLAI